MRAAPETGEVGSHRFRPDSRARLPWPSIPYCKIAHMRQFLMVSTNCIRRPASLISGHSVGGKVMKKLLLASLAALLPAIAFGAESGLQWAYPVAPQGLPQPDPAKTFQAKGTKTGMMLTMKEINNNFGPPDWFPDEHPPMAAIVKNGRAPHVRACMLCHLPTGNG